MQLRFRGADVRPLLGQFGWQAHREVLPQILAIDDVNLATEQFVHIVLGGVRDRVIVGVMRRPNLAQRKRIAQQAVRIFLSGTLLEKASGPGALA